MTIINNLMVSSFVRKRYSLQDLQKVSHLLSENNSLYFPALDNGLFSAAAVTDFNQFGKKRRYDSALLFLIYPLQVVTEEQTSKILDDVIQNLQGEYGIARYKGDSFWCKDYQDIPQSIRTSIELEREEWFTAQGRKLQDGEEAQWCIFDPIISAIYGLKYQNIGDARFLDKQTHYFNRSLGQLTSEDFYLGGFKSPELYYLQNGKYIPNDSTPLLWTQANLLVALKLMDKSLRLNDYSQ